MADGVLHPVLGQAWPPPKPIPQPPQAMGTLTQLKLVSDTLFTLHACGELQGDAMSAASDALAHVRQLVQSLEPGWVEGDHFFQARGSTI